MLKINSVTLNPVDDNSENILKAVLKKTALKKSDIKEFKIFKRSIDARKKADIKITYSVLLSLYDKKAEKRLLEGKNKDIAEYAIPHFEISKAVNKDKRVIVCGMGPAGLFCALALAKSGIKPIVLERGGSMEERTKKVDRFFETGELDDKTNIQFGEGGAGTFSDGKLNTGISDLRLKFVCDTFIRHGAPENIAYMAKPHVGTDLLRKIIVSIREEIICLGGSVRFNSEVSDIKIDNGAVHAAVLKNGEEISCDAIVMAIGHSARNTFEMLKEKGAAMQAKAFAIGVRAEHPQSFINRAQFGDFEHEPSLGAAEYKIWTHLKNGRGVYSFCMCPGGVVVGAASETGGVVTNGMSYHARDGKNANAAILCDVKPADFGSDDVLAGMYFQRKWEKKAFEVGGGNYRAPVSRLEDFLSGRASKSFGEVLPTYKPGVSFADLNECLPEFVTESLKAAFLDFDKKIKGYKMADALLTGVETRSSSPVRILRGEDLQSLTVKGLYPCGEGGGYAGGIMSAAADGIKVALAIIGG